MESSSLLSPPIIFIVARDQSQATCYNLPPCESLTAEISRSLSASRSSSVGASRSRTTSSSKKISPFYHPPMSNKRIKARMWHEALRKKRNAAKMMLAAQQVIEEVEEEICESVPRDTMEKLHSKYYNIAGDDDDATTKTYLAAISAVRVEQLSETSHPTLED